jgi:acetyl-CoA carboxylase, biotin carboxylase subunit
MGDKAVARKNDDGRGRADGAGQPGAIEDADERAGDGAARSASRSDQGGGRRWRQGHARRHDAGDVPGQLQMAQNEARPRSATRPSTSRSTFPPRHIEIQVMGDQHGNVMHLGERECSLQRRHQKLWRRRRRGVTPELRERMGEAAIRGAKAIGYFSAGTVEFLLDEDGSFYFMEMNTRIQVEHPVTELVTGVDLVKEQIRVAAGERLSVLRRPPPLRGHCIECRINAEDPEAQLRAESRADHDLPPAGRPGRARGHARLRGAILVPPFYDSLIGKLIVHGNTREEALRGRAGR